MLILFDLIAHGIFKTVWGGRIERTNLQARRILVHTIRKQSRCIKEKALVKLVFSSNLILRLLNDVFKSQKVKKKKFLVRIWSTYTKTVSRKA